MSTNFIDEKFCLGNKKLFRKSKTMFDDIHFMRVISGRQIPIIRKVCKSFEDITKQTENLILSGIDNNKERTEEHLKKLKRMKTPIVLNLKKKIANKYLFKDIIMSDKIEKTKIKEFTFSPNKKKKKITPYFFLKKNISNLDNRNKKEKHHINNKKLTRNISSNLFYSSFHNNKIDSFFITKLPIQTKTTFSKKSQLKKMKRIIKQSGSNMLDIYNGLKNFSQDITTDYYPYNIKNRIKNNDKNENSNKYINAHDNYSNKTEGIKSKFQNSKQVDKAFKKIFSKIFEVKKYSKEKVDPRQLLDPLEKICGGSYKEVKLDNLANNNLGQRIWIKKSTANLISYGKSFQLISDNIFYKERKRIIDIYPNLAKEAELFVPYKKIEKVSPLIVKLKQNVKNLKNVYVCHYNLIRRVRQMAD